MKLPSWFGTPKKTENPPSSSELAARLKDAEAAEQAAKARVGTAGERLAAERSTEALDAVDAAELDARRVSRMVTILRSDHAAAIERERQEHLARLRTKRDSSRERRGECVGRADAVRARRAAQLVAGWVAGYVEEAAELTAAAALDREIQNMAKELGEAEPNFTLAAQPDTFALAAAVAALAHEVPAGYHRLFQELIHAVEPASWRIEALQRSVETAARLAEERRVQSLSSPAAPPLEVVRLDAVHEPREQPRFVRQIAKLLDGGDAA